MGSVKELWQRLDHLLRTLQEALGLAPEEELVPVPVPVRNRRRREPVHDAAGSPRRH